MSRIAWYVKDDHESRVVNRLIIPGLDLSTEEPKAIDDLIAFIIKHKNEITKVELQHANLSACSRDQLGRLFGALASLPHLEEIDLSGNDLCNALCDIGLTLASCPKLHTVILQRALPSTDITRQTAVLTQFLQISSLTNLDCSHCDFSLIDTVNMRAVAEALTAARNLKSLNLCRTYLEFMDSEAFTSLTRALLSLNLLALDISNNSFFPDETTAIKLKPRDVSDFLLELSQNKSLEVLRLAAIGLGYWNEKDLTEFFKNLQTAKRKSLDISFNELEMGLWVNELAKLIRQESFRALIIKTNGLGDAGIEILEEAIKSNAAFEKLEASANHCETDILGKLEILLEERSITHSGRKVSHGRAGSAAGGAGAEAGVAVEAEGPTKANGGAGAGAGVATKRVSGSDTNGTGESHDPTLPLWIGRR